jgi:hypothetical protein
LLQQGNKEDARKEIQRANELDKQYAAPGF